MGKRFRESDDSSKAKATPAAQVDSFSVEKKIAEINTSRLSDAEKKKYINQLAGDAKPVDPDHVPFSVYARIRGIVGTKLAGMKAFPKARGVQLASMAQWDEIYKNF